MTDQMKVQAAVEVSTENAESALKRVGDAAGQMAERMQREGIKAGEAVDGIGSGASKSADEFSRAEGRIAASIKRATTNLELLGKTASQKLEFKIEERGLDKAKFDPLLSKLRELELRSQEASRAARLVYLLLRPLPHCVAFQRSSPTSQPVSLAAKPR